MGARTGRTLGAVVAAALLAACGSTSGGANNTGNESSLPPTKELTDSVRALTTGHQLTLTFSLGATLADIAHISAVEHDTPPPAAQNAMTQDRIRISLQAPPGETLGAFHPTAASPAGAFALTFGDAHKDYFAFEVVNGSLYGRIDLRYFTTLGGNPRAFALIQRQVAAMPAFVRAAVNGQWVSLPASTLKALSGFAQGFAGAQGVTPPTPNPAKLLRFSHQLLTTLLSDLSVTRVSSGAVDHLALSFQLRRVLSDEYAVVRPFIRSFVPFAGALPPLRPTSIPPVTPHLDAYVTGGALSKVVLDAGQFDTKHHFSFPVVLSLSRQGPAIAPPSGAIPVNLPQIGQLLGSVGA